MKMKKFLALSTASVMALSMVACGNTDNGAAESSASTTPATAEASTEAGTAEAEVTGLNYAELTLGEDYTDITTTIKVLTNRTDDAQRRDHPCDYHAHRQGHRRAL